MSSVDNTAEVEELRRLLGEALAEKDSIAAEKDSIAAEKDSIAAEKDSIAAGIRWLNTYKTFADLYQKHYQLYALDDKSSISTGDISTTNSISTQTERIANNQKVIPTWSEKEIEEYFEHLDIGRLNKAEMSMFEKEWKTAPFDHNSKVQGVDTREKMFAWVEKHMAKQIEERNERKAKKLKEPALSLERKYAKPLANMLLLTAESFTKNDGNLRKRRLKVFTYAEGLDSKIKTPSPVEEPVKEGLLTEELETEEELAEVGRTPSDSRTGSGLNSLENPGDVADVDGKVKPLCDDVAQCNADAKDMAEKEGSWETVVRKDSVHEKETQNKVTPSKPVYDGVVRSRKGELTATSMIGRPRRCPDDLLYLSDEYIAKLSPRMQRLGILSVEVKTEVDELRKEAILGLRRDFIRFQSPLANSRKCRSAVGVITNGVQWSFVQFQMVQYESFRLGIEAKISRVYDAMENVQVVFEYLVRFIRAGIHEATLESSERYQPTEAFKSVVGNIVPERVLGYNEDKSIAFLCGLNVLSSARKQIVLKIPASEAPRVRMQVEHEMRIWQMIQGLKEFYEHTAQLVLVPEFKNVPVVCTYYAGHTLDEWINRITDREELRKLAILVFVNVWTALLKLHHGGYCFIDVHPGNIAIEGMENRTIYETFVVSNQYAVKLIDVESIVEIKAKLEGVPKYQKFKPVVNKSCNANDLRRLAQREHDWQSLIFVIASIIDFQGFHRLRTANQQKLMKTKRLIVKKAKQALNKKGFCWMANNENSLRDIGKILVDALQ